MAARLEGGAVEGAHMEINVGYVKGSHTFTDMAHLFRQLPAVLQADAFAKGAVGGAKLIAQELRHKIEPSDLPVPRRLDKHRVRRAHTRDLIRVVKRRARDGEMPAALVHGIGASYFLEFGTEHLPAMRVFSRTADANASRIPKVYERAIRNQLRTVIRQLKRGKLTRKVGRALADEIGP